MSQSSDNRTSTPIDPLPPPSQHETEQNDSNSAAVGSPFNETIRDAIMRNDAESLNSTLSTLGGNTHLNQVLYDKDKTALIFAAGFGSTKIVKFLAATRDINLDLQDENGESALLHASAAGHTEIVKILIRAGANVNLANKEKMTPLIVAAHRGHVDVCRALLDEGHANIDLREKTNRTALILASYEGHHKVVQALASRKANLDQVDKYGWTALMLAAYRGRFDTCQQLLEYDANTNIETLSGKTAATLALDAGHDSIYKLINNYHATTKSAHGKQRASMGIQVQNASTSTKRNTVIVPMTGKNLDRYTSKGYMMPVDDLQDRRISISSKHVDKRRTHYYSVDANTAARRFSTAPHVRQDMAPRPKYTPWVIFSIVITSCVPSKVLAKIAKMGDSRMRLAWREKVALCLMVLVASGFIAFTTFGFHQVSCGGSLGLYEPLLASKFGQTGIQKVMIIRGKIYNTGNYFQSGLHRPILPFDDSALSGIINPTFGTDVSDFFPLDHSALNCRYNGPKYANGALCAAARANDSRYHCHTSLDSTRALASTWSGTNVVFSWDDITNTRTRKLFAYRDNVYDITSVLDTSNTNNWFANDQTLSLFSSVVGMDATAAIARRDNLTDVIPCLDHFLVGKVDGFAVECNMSSFLVLSLTGVFVATASIRFLSATVFQVVISKETNRILQNRPEGKLKYAIVFVACYSEDEGAIRGTLDSLAETDYPNEQKLLLVIADGNITGSGNDKSTPEIIKGLMEIVEPQTGDPEPKSYLSLGEGKKRHNMAQVYAGHYRFKGERTPMILINKCGNPEERKGPKAGNRGKRDSQIILMQLLTHAFFNEDMSELEFDTFEKIHYLMGVTVDRFEYACMVDSDTLLEREALTRVIATMESDPKITGICGETKILNTFASWVTMIQVFDYYISHHLGKSFEAVFGTVTCLPGCFCMYRVYVEKYDGSKVPILANPDILREYSATEVETVHQKNLLLLGEDRYLTTLMLRAFPTRKTHYCATAKCYTVVPETFSVLLSQRRRWINGTVHNLMELVRTPQLPGIFCFSMQFAMFLELFSTVTTPFAALFIVYLIISAALGQSVILPLVSLAANLSLQVLLVALTTYEPIYLVWFLLYLLSYPVWNLILPAYAFWHFDDFSWGSTRKIDGVDNGHGNEKSKASDMVQVVKMKKWNEWVLYLWERNALPHYCYLREVTLRTGDGERERVHSIAETLEKLTGETAGGDSNRSSDLTKNSSLAIANSSDRSSDSSTRKSSSGGDHATTTEISGSSSSGSLTRDRLNVQIFDPSIILE